MKRIIVVLGIMLLCGLSARAQNSLSYKDSLDIYEGTWKYENANTKEIFIIKLKEFTDHKDNDVNYNFFGTYSYSKGGVEITNTHNVSLPLKYLNNYTDIPLNELSNVPIWIDCWCAKKSGLYFMDKKYNKNEGGGYVQLLSTKAGDEKLLWYPQNGEGVRTYIVGEPEEPDGFSVPVNVVMTKVH